MTPPAAAPADRLRTLRIPVVAAPMLGVSGPDLVVAACRAGIAGAFPSANCASPAELGEWLRDIRARVSAPGPREYPSGPVCVNVIVHRSNPRLEDDLRVVAGSAADIVITSVGSPDGLVDDLHRSGHLVWADVASLRHLDRAAAAGVDGVVLLTAGAGGQTGWANPLSFTRVARARFAGTIALAGGIGDGVSIAAARMLGADLAYCGTRFIATAESAATDPYKAAVRRGSLDDVVLTDEVTGLPANMLRQSLNRDRPAGGAVTFDVATTLGGANGRPSRWNTCWSAGHAVSLVEDIPTVADLVETLSGEYLRARGPDRDATALVAGRDGHHGRTL
jgi:nitronate monooxygenase